LKQSGEEEESQRKRYDELYSRVHKAIEWLDDPIRTNEEVEKWLSIYEKMFDEWMAEGRLVCNGKR